MQRKVASFGEQTVGFNRAAHVRGLDGDDEVLEAQPDHPRDAALRALAAGRGRWPAVLLGDILLKRAGVDTDADGDAALARRRCYLAQAYVIPDVPGVDAQLRGPTPRSLHSKAIIEVDVGHNGELALRADALEAVEGFGGGDSDAHDLRARDTAELDLLKHCLSIGRVRLGHALD